MGVLLSLVLGYLYRANFYPLLSGSHPTLSAEPAPLAGKNTVSGLEVKQGKGGLWTADFDYFYTGQPRLPHYESNCRRSPDHPRVPTVPNVETRICRLLSRAHIT